jgi:tRNA G18 (ribose-2'-O)-methylase SpoU
MVAILHNIRSLHNVGSIFRTADAAGIEKLYLCGITPAPVDRFGKVRPQVAKVALGAERYVTWDKRHGTGGVINKLKSDGYKIVAVEQSKKSIPYYRVTRDKRHGIWKTAIIVGNEITGLPKTVLQKADTIVEIPMHGKKESLNVAVAFGIIAFHFIHV